MTRLCSVTILYNPDEGVISNIESYSRFVEKCFIIDNTEGRNNYHLLVNANIDKHKIEYIAFEVNKGMAEALNYSCSLAYEQGFSWILTMDQDSSLNTPAFLNDFNSLISEDNIGIVAASYPGKTFFTKEYTQVFYAALFVITSGNLVNLNAWSTVKFNEKLFIDEVDNDFCLRLGEQGFKILLSKNPYLEHAIGSIKIVKPFFLRKPLTIGIHTYPVRSYYITRNGLYVIKRYLFKNPAFATNRIKNLVLRFIITIFFYPNKYKCVRYTITGVKDFLISKFGRLVA